VSEWQRQTLYCVIVLGILAALALGITQ